MDSKFKDKSIKWTVGILMVSIILGGIIFAWPVFQRRQSLLKQEREWTRKIAEKNREIAQINENQHRFKTDPDFVEQIARQNRRVFPGELVFVFDEEEK